MNWQGKKIFFVGIKGTGVSGLALLLKGEGAQVSGSDTDEEFPAQEVLKKNSVEIKLFDEKNITPELDLIIYSGAYGPGHPERKKAKELNIPELSYIEALSEFAKDKKVIVVTGTHGKTTTTALLGVIFEAAGLDPVVLAGDIVKNWGSSIRAGQGEYFIVEGDEYQEKFRYFKPVGIVIPSLDWDHPDYFKTPEEYQASFQNWIRENPQAKLVTASESEDEKIFQETKFVLPGKKYKANALLAIRLARLFEIPDQAIIRALTNFQGVRRRLEYYSDRVIYDYAHHPAEIQATLEALSEKYPARPIVAVFQPHTYSRTAAFLEEFAKSFEKAELVFFEKIYSSAREKIGGVTIEALIQRTRNYHKKVFSFDDFIPEKLPKNSLFIFMGAGDIWQQARKLAGLLGGAKSGPD